MTARPIEALERRTLLAFSPIQVGSSDYDSGFETAIDPQGNIVETGLFHGTIDFDPGSGVVKRTAVGETDIYIAKYTQSGQLIWVGQMGGIESDKNEDWPTDPSRDGSFVNRVGIQLDFLGEHVNAIALDASGNIFLTGTFYHTADFNPTSGVFNLTANTKYGLYDAFLVKLNPNGKLTWAKNFGGQFNDVGNGVAIDPQGNPIVTGYFTRDADFDPNNGVFNVHALGRDDIYVAKYSGSSGSLVWVDRFGGDATKQPARDAGNGITMDGSGNTIITGTFAGDDVDFDPSPTKKLLLTSRKRTDAFLLKLNSNGGLIFAESFGGEGYTGGVKVAFNAGSIYTVSYFQGKIDADPGPATVNFTSIDDNEFTDLLISKYHGDGSLQWAKRIGGEEYETIGGFKVAKDGSVYTSGGFTNKVDFDPSANQFNLTSTLGADDFDDPNDDGRDYSYDIFVSRLSSSGKFLAATRIGSTSDDYGTGIALTADNNTVILTGQFRGTVAFNPQQNKFKLKSVGLEDSFLIELNTELELLT